VRPFAGKKLHGIDSGQLFSETLALFENACNLCLVAHRTNLLINFPPIFLLNFIILFFHNGSNPSEELRPSNPMG
jgi:hypothetical protein